MIQKNQSGIFQLNGINIRYDLDLDYFNSTTVERNCWMSHFDFHSVDYPRPNDLTETGYRSWFVHRQLLDEAETIEEVLTEYLKSMVGEDVNLVFSPSEAEPEIAWTVQDDLFAGLTGE